MRRYRKNNLLKSFGVCISIIVLLYILGLVIMFLVEFFHEEKSNIDKISSSEAYSRAMDMINYKWSYENKELMEDIILPYYIKDKGEYIGIPYCYGGQISLDYSNSNNVKNFEDALKKGYYPGNISTKKGYVENTAGVDCSGFIAASFNIKEKISTSSMDKYFKEINIKKIKPMDILNSKGRHVYIYLGESSDKKGINILEATSNGGKKYKDKTVVNYKTMEEFKKDLDSRGYTPMRYKGIKEDKLSVELDKYEYNNKEAYSKAITFNSDINGSIDYIEDLDYYHSFINENIDGEVGISINKLEPNQEIVIYNNKEELKINSVGEYKINLKGKVYIKVYLNNTEINKKDYSFKLQVHALED